MATKINLPETEVEKETTLSCMIERQHLTPSEKNLESMFNALKDCSVYIPAKLLISKEEQKKIREAIIKKKPVPQNPNMRVTPQLMVNKQGGKIMPWFSREVEFEAEKTPGITFMRIHISKAVELCDNMPDAFDIVLDLFTHPVKVTLDEMIAGLNGEKLGGDNEPTDEV